MRTPSYAHATLAGGLPDRRVHHFQVPAAEVHGEVHGEEDPVEPLFTLVCFTITFTFTFAFPFISHDSMVNAFLI